jgi:integrase
MRKGARLSAVGIQKLAEPGRYPDGGGLYLRVTPEGTKNWIFRFMRNYKAREMGLGPIADMGLAEARERAGDLRKVLRRGLDPIAERMAESLNRAEAEASVRTFRECAEAYIAAHQGSWKHPKHVVQWKRSLDRYAYPRIGSLPVHRIELEHVLGVLEPIWYKVPETASRVRNRVELVLSYATAKRCRQGPNPAQWKGNLDQILPKRSRVKKREHFAALPRDQIGEFLVAIRKEAGAASRALEFLILTATRTNEVLGTTWGEIDLQNRIWTIPAARMKAGKEHRVPLCDRALKILDEMRTLFGERLVFPGRNAGAQLSDMAMLQVIKRASFKVTAHGFRSTFSDWVSECTNHSKEVREMALAHVIDNETEAAYRRGDLFEKRRALAEEWGDFCQAKFLAAHNFATKR